jgi:hypothetical protein
MAVIQATTQTQNGIHSASVVNIEGFPDAITPVTYGASELLAALALCSALAMGPLNFDPSTSISISGLPSVTNLYQGI